ncbi:MAG: P-loop NTPase fold protein [Sulfurovum sp.]
MKFLNDEYTLDIKELADINQIARIRELILNAPTPFSIGISGRWGSGKSSIMKHLMASLGGEPIKHKLNFQDKTIDEEQLFTNVFNRHIEKDTDKIKHILEHTQTIWFNPWENENHQEPMVGLLQAIHHHFSFIASTLQEAEKLASVTFQSALDMIGSLTKLGRNQGTNIQAIGEKYEHDNFQYIDRQQKFKFIFQEAIEILLQRGKEAIDEDARIVIFIDDLDRCEDETISKLLKEIKQYLSTKRCIFVFGYDRHHIEKSLSSTTTKTSKETRAYLEKLFQATFYIKEPKTGQIKDFAKDIIEPYPFLDSQELEEFTAFISSIIDPNPRRLKNFLMAIYFHIASSSDYGNSARITLDNLKKLALIAYLKLFYESVYSALENQPELMNTLIDSLKNNNIFDVANEKEYYFKLEFKNHLDLAQNSLADELIDELEESSTQESKDKFVNKIEYTREFEEKFLSEVYEMQGKHKSFSKFIDEFSRSFDSLETDEIKKYL